MAILLTRRLSGNAGGSKTAQDTHTTSNKARGSMNSGDASLGGDSGKFSDEPAHSEGTPQRCRSLGRTLSASISRKLSGRRNEAPKAEYSGPQYYQPAERPVNEESQKMDNQLDALLNTPDPESASDEAPEDALLNTPDPESASDEDPEDEPLASDAGDEKKQAGPTSASRAQYYAYMAKADDTLRKTPSLVGAYDQLTHAIEHELQGVDSALSESGFAEQSMEPHVMALVNGAPNPPLEVEFAEINDLVLNLQRFL